MNRIYDEEIYDDRSAKDVVILFSAIFMMPFALGYMNFKVDQRARTQTEARYEQALTSAGYTTSAIEDLLKPKDPRQVCLDETMSQLINDFELTSEMDKDSATRLAEKMCEERCYNKAVRELNKEYGIRDINTAIKLTENRCGE
ncbi:hypothetical protein GOV07_04840 [Candidatus Woesearchaeota archaeon]|nr:hypothetical protein [Candidatus Woesearchaeota archaeon]